MKWVHDSPSDSGYYWFSGWPFNRPIIAEVFKGVRSRKVDGVREYYPECNLRLFAENQPDMPAWKSDGWPDGQWFGPIEVPKGFDPVVHPVLARLNKGND